MLRLIFAAIAGMMTGYQFHKYRQLKKDQELYEACDEILNSETTHEMIDRDVEKQLMEHDLKCRLRDEEEKSKILYSDLDQYIKGVK